MNAVYLYTFLSVIGVSLLSFVGLVTFPIRERVLSRVVMVMVSLAVGALLGDAFIHLIPESFEAIPNTSVVGLLVIAGMLIFFVLEKFFHWHHIHEETEEGIVYDYERDRRVVHVHPTGYLILFSDGLHNLLDGIIIGAGYLVSFEVGLATTLAIMLHEIPQEVGDFGVLLHSGFSKAKALFMNFLSALTAVVGAFLALLLGEVGGDIVTWIVPIAAGGFIYIAGSDLIPELHKTTRPGRSVVQFVAVLVGIAIMFVSGG